MSLDDLGKRLERRRWKSADKLAQELSTGFLGEAAGTAQQPPPYEDLISPPYLEYDDFPLQRQPLDESGAVHSARGAGHGRRPPIPGQGWQPLEVQAPTAQDGATRTRQRQVIEQFVGIVVRGTGRIHQVRLLAQRPDIGRKLQQIIDQETRPGFTPTISPVDAVEVYLPMLAEDAELPPGTVLIPVLRIHRVDEAIDRLPNAQTGQPQTRRRAPQRSSAEYLGFCAVWLRTKTIVDPLAIP